MKQDELLPGETVLWTGRPVRHVLLRPYDLAAAPLFLALCGVVVHVGSDVLAHRLAGERVPTVLLVWYGTLALVALCMAVGPFSVRWLVLRGTRYAVTNQRVLVRTRVLGLSWTRSEYLWNLAPPIPRMRKDGTGTVWFGDSGPRGRLLTTSPNRAVRPCVLYEVPDVRRVVDLIAGAQRRQSDA